jgi:hypothetical protein
MRRIRSAAVIGLWSRARPRRHVFFRMNEP